MAEACYKDPYLPASYKGVPFEALEVNSQHGRRGAEGEFPFGEETAYADMGRSIRTYSISGRFATNDHVLRAAALIAVVELPGPGPLVHPTRGVIMAACKQLRVRDNPTEEQGVTYFDMDMVEANVWPNGLSLVGFVLGLALAPLIEGLNDSFDEQYHPEEATFYDRGAVLGTASTSVNSIYTGYVQAAKNENNIKVYRSFAAFQTLSSDPGLLAKPNTMKQAMSDGMALIDKYGTSVQKQQLFREIINQNGGSILVGRTGRASVNAVQSYTRLLAAGYMAKAFLEVTPADMNEAFTQYDRVVAVFEEELKIINEACDSKLYVRLSRFFEDLKGKLLNRAYNSPPLIAFQFGSAVPSVVAAYEIYTDATQFLDLEKKNPYGFPWMIGPTVIGARPN
jgi:prophage DNA circulation protein